MALNANVVIAYDGINASIPAGYSRYIALDGNYPLGAAAGNSGGTAGGAANHTHTETGHTPIQNSHTHTFAGGASLGMATVTLATILAPSNTHTHASKASTAATATNQSVTTTFNTTSNDPPYYEVIWIQSDGSAGIPINGMGWLNSQTVPANFVQVNTNVFWKGAAAGGNAGGIGGSLDAHTHTETAAHTHAQNAHTHSAVNSNVPTGNVAVIGGAGIGEAARNHTHSVSLDSATAVNNSVTLTLVNADGQPPWKKLLGIKNNSGSSQAQPTGFVALWFASLATIPAGWYLCDGTNTTVDMRDKFTKNANATTELGTTGGADQHTHTSSNCQPTQVTHNHTATAGNGAGMNADYSVPDINVALDIHTHTWTIGNTIATNQAATVTINLNTAKDNYPLYLTAAFIQFGLIGSKTPLRMLMGVGL